MVLWRPTRPSRTNTKKSGLFIIGDWNAKAGSQEIPGVTSKFGLWVQNEASRAKANRVMQREHTGYRKHPLPTPQRWLYTWSLPDGQHPNQIDSIHCSQRWSSIESVKPRLGGDYGSTHELVIAKFRLKLNKVGKTTRLIRYDLNQIPYDYTVKVTNRFKVLDLIECWQTMDGDLWHYTGGMIKTTPKKKKCKKPKWSSEEALQIAEKRREVKGKGEKERYTIWMQSSNE